MPKFDEIELDKMVDGWLNPRQAVAPARRRPMLLEQLLELARTSQFRRRRFSPPRGGPTPPARQFPGQEIS